MRIQYPEYLWLLLLLVPLLLTYILGYRRGRQNLRILGGVWRERQLANIYLVKRFFMGLFSILFAASLILAVSGVTWGRRPVKETRSGTDILFAVDLSRSMMARDVEPSRLDRAVLLMESLLQGLSGERCGLVGFKGKAQTLVPLTEDTTALTRFSGYLNPATLTAPGTDLELALEEAIRALHTGDGRYKVLVLFTDGGGMSGVPGSLIRRFREQDIILYAVGLGTREGARIPLEGERWVENSRGTPVVTRLKEDVLRKLAGGAEKGGYFFGGHPAAAGSLRSQLREDTGAGRGPGVRYEEKSRFRLFLGLAMLFFILNLMVRGIRWKGIF